MSSDLPTILVGVGCKQTALPLTPLIKLYLLQDDYPRHSLVHGDYARLMDAPPYWAFCWGGGQALAKWILDNPGFVEGRRVLDFGAGSGVAAIAALKAGAASAVAVDIDPGALQACRANAQLNHVDLPTLSCLPVSSDCLLLAADICYEEEGLSAVVAHIDNGGEAIVAESRLRDLCSRFPNLEKVAKYQARTLPDLDESEKFDLVHIFRSKQ